MDFDPTPEESAFRTHVERVLDERIAPELPAWKSAKTTPHRMFELLGKEELLGFRQSGKGGLGNEDGQGTEDEQKTDDGQRAKNDADDATVEPIPWLHNIHFYRQAARLDGGFAIAAFANTQLALQALHYYGDERQRRDYLLPGVRGERVVAFANTEPGAGSDASAIKLTAEDRGDHYLLNGSKSYITNGDIADHIVFTAVTHPEEEKQHRRISLFVVDGNKVTGDPASGSIDGLSRSRMKKLGWKISHLSVLHFRNVKIPKENLIGSPGRGFYQTMHVFNTSRIGIAALALGTGLGAYAEAFRHASKRSAFGKKLIEHESKRNEFAENMALLQAGWLLVQKAAFLKDTGKEFRYNSAMAKLFCTEEGLAVSQWATETFGARGLMESIKVSQYPLDAKAALMGEGAPEVQKMIIAGHIGELLEEL